jgi:hypothetical protein
MPATDTDHQDHLEHRTSSPQPSLVQMHSIYEGTPDIPPDMRISEYRRARSAGQSRRRWRRFF